MFSSALQSGQLGPLMQQFGFDSDVAQAAARGGGWVGEWAHFGHSFACVMDS